MKALVEQLNLQFSEDRPEELIAHLLHTYGSRVALASSLGLEDQVLTDMIIRADKSARIFTIDTGRLFPQTYKLIAKTTDHYHFRMEVYSPEHRPVEEYVMNYGINGFYDSIESRKSCCRVRKIEPLMRALSTLDVWICGLRREQSVTRTEVKLVEWDEANGLIKVNPLVKYTEQDVWDYIKQYNVPYNPLHHKNYPSIGCEPCTRAVQPGEDIRSGRWWWESPDHKECGLHTANR